MEYMTLSKLKFPSKAWSRKIGIKEITETGAEREVTDEDDIFLDGSLNGMYCF